MKKFIFFIVMLLISMQSTYASSREIGIGIILGEPTGISAKKWISQKKAFDFAVAWSFSEDNSVQFHADYLIHKFHVLSLPELKGNLPFYYGLGGRLLIGNKSKSGEDTALGLRIPCGLTYIFKDLPLDVFFELVPILDLIPDTDFHLNAAVGIRLYFK